MNRQRFLTSSSSWALLVVLVLSMVAPAQVLAAPDAPAPDAAPQAGVTLDGTPTTQTASSGTTISWSHTTGTGTNRLLLVGVSWNSNTVATSISSVTFTPSGGGDVLYLNEVISRKYASNMRYAAIWSSPAEPPQNTSGTIAVTFSASVSSGIVAGAANFSGVDITTPIGSPNGADASSTAPSVTLTGLAGDELVFDTLFVGGTSTSATVGDNQTQAWNAFVSPARGAASYEQATGSSVTMSWTTSNSIWVAVAVPIFPACTGTRYTLTAGNDGHGTVTLNPPGGSYCSGRSVTLTPVPNSGYLFSSWGGTNAGDIGNTGGVYSIVMDGDKSVTANFAPESCQDVSLTAEDDTYLSAAATTTNYGNSTTLQVDQTSGNSRRTALLRWNLGSLPANATIKSAGIQLQVTDASTIAYPLYDVTKAWVEGDGTSGSGATWATYDGTTTWGTAGASGTTGDVDRGITNLWSSTTSSFTPVGSKTVSLNADGVAMVQGWVNGATNNGVIIQQYSGTTSNNMIFESAESTTEANRPKLNINYCVPAGATHDLTIAVDPSGGGTTTPSAGAHTYAENAVVNVTATPTTGYEFDRWEGACTGTDPDVCQVTMDADKTVTAYFTAIPQYTLTVNTSGPGSVTLNPTGGTYYRDTVVTLTPVPGDCATFSTWSGANQGDIIDTGGVYTIVMDGDKTVQANFTALPQYTLAAGNDGHGSVTLDPAGGTYCTGTTVTLTPAPDTGYVFESWGGTNAGDIVDTAGVYTILMSENKSVTANFTEAPPPYLDGAVSSNTAGSGGSISVGYTTGTGSDRLMLVGVSWNCGTTDRTISSVTFTPAAGGGAITLDPVITQQAGTQLRYSAIYRWPNGTELPSGQAGTLTITFSGSVSNGIMAGVANFAGVDQTTPLGTPGGAGSGTNDTAPTVTLTGLNGNELVFDNLFQGAGSNTQTLTVGPDQTVLWYPDYVANLRAAASTERATGSSVTMSWTASSASYWAIAAVPINPAAGVTCYALTLGHTGNGATPTAAPANSTGCPAGEYVAGESISLSGAAAGTGSGIASWYGTSDNNSKASTNSLTMPASAHSAGVNYLRLLGDVNQDGFANSTDALIVLSADADLDTSALCPMNYGDANGDGVVTSTDALVILTYDAGLPVGSFPVEQPVPEPALSAQPPGCNPGPGSISRWLRLLTPDF